MAKLNKIGVSTRELSGKKDKEIHRLNIISKKMQLK